MKKAKLLLLGLVSCLSLIGFTSAYQFNKEVFKIYEGTSSSSITSVEPFDKVSNSDVCFSAFYLDPVGGQSWNCNSSVTISYNFGSVTGLKPGQTICKTASNVFGSSKTNTTISLQVGNSCNYKVKVYQTASVEGLSPNGVDDIFPAVEGVKITVNQIIPLVIYIGIGLLVVTLGFYCIKWLVYWIYNKLNSVFSSRK